jgi:hypothetical protein
MYFFIISERIKLGTLEFTPLTHTAHQPLALDPIGIKEIKREQDRKKYLFCRMNMRLVSAVQ